MCGCSLIRTSMRVWLRRSWRSSCSGGCQICGCCRVGGGRYTSALCRCAMFIIWWGKMSRWCYEVVPLVWWASLANRFHRWRWCLCLDCCSPLASQSKYFASCASPPHPRTPLVSAPSQSCSAFACKTPQTSHTPDPWVLFEYGR